MKNTLMIAAGLALAFAACNSVDKGDDNNLAKGPLKITGEIAGMDTGRLEFLYPVADSSHSDTVLVKGGKFEFSFELKEPTNMIFRKLGTRGEEVSFFADPGKVTITGYKDSMWTSKVKGGPTQTLFLQADEKFREIIKPAEGLSQAYSAAQQSQNVNEIMRIQQEFNRLQDSAKSYAKSFVFTNRNSIVAPYFSLVYLPEAGKEDLLKSVYDTLTPAVKKSYFGTKLEELISSMSKTSIGVMAPDFTQNDPAGQPVSLSSLRGQYVLVDFWASWCAPCRQENPNVVNAYNAYKDKGFTIIGVSLDQDKAAWEKAILDDKLTWTHVSDLKYFENAVAKTYGIRSIPASFLLDKEGRIIAKDLRGDALAIKLAELIPANADAGKATAPAK
jgi:peroxiredoxin